MFFIYFIVGFYFLLKGADLLVDGSSSLAARFKLNQVIIGLTIMAFGTSAPEFFVSLISVFKGSDSVALSNIFGSTVVNVFLVLGLAASFKMLEVNKRIMKLELPYTIVVSIILFFALNDSIVDPLAINTLDRYDGMILLTFFGFFIWTLFNYKEGFFESKNSYNELTPFKTYSFIVFGFLFLSFGSYQVVESGLLIAEFFGLGEAIIGALFISLGTSLPEIITSLTAYKKQNHELMVGNIVGSNLFNLLFILGTVSILNPISYDSSINFYLYYMLFAKFFILIFLFFNKAKVISRQVGVIFVLCYLSFLFLSLR